MLSAAVAMTTRVVVMVVLGVVAAAAGVMRVMSEAVSLMV